MQAMILVALVAGLVGVLQRVWPMATWVLRRGCCIRAARVAGTRYWALLRCVAVRAGARVAVQRGSLRAVVRRVVVGQLGCSVLVLLVVTTGGLIGTR
jgi:hypothetical protein